MRDYLPLQRNWDARLLSFPVHRAVATYCFRIACYYFVLGVDRYNETKVEDSVQLLTTSYIVNKKILDDPPHCNHSETKVGTTNVLYTLGQCPVE